MPYSPAELREAALRARADFLTRVNGPQQGVTTFFDNLLWPILSQLLADEAVHGWDVQRKPADAADSKAVLASRWLPWLARFLEVRGKGRFVPYDIRLREDETGPGSDIGYLEMMMSVGTTACLEWKGRPLFKTVFDVAVLQMLLWELRPATVLEIGSGAGASAVWMADMLRSFGIEATIHSVDIKLVSESHPGVRFLAGDCTSPATLFDLDLLRSAPRPWLVLEDAHVNVHDVLAHMDRFLVAGDYLVVEDSRMKIRELGTFMQQRMQHYQVDTRYTDFFGRNATCAPNSIFLRT